MLWARSGQRYTHMAFILLGRVLQKKGQSPPSSGDSTNMAEPALVSIATGDHVGPTADCSSDPAPVDESSRGT